MNIISPEGAKLRFTKWFKSTKVERCSRATKRILEGRSKGGWSRL